MDVKIGVTDSGRELLVSSASSQEEIRDQVSAALKDLTSTLSLEDDKGRVVLVPAARIAYVEIAAADARRVGFAV